MAENIANSLKYARFIAIAHIIVGLLLFVFGIIDRVHGHFWTGYGCFGIWCGTWMCITGGLGIPASQRERTSSSNAVTGTFMGFAITSTVFGGVVIICYSISTAIYSHEHWYTRRESYHSEMAVTAIILILGIVEFAIGIWAAVLCCLVINCCYKSSVQATPVMYVTGQGVSMVPGGYVMGQGPGGVPVAIPVQQAGGIVTIPGGHAQMVHIPPQGVVQQAGQPPMYQVSTHGGQMVGVPSGAQVGPVPSSGAEHAHSHLFRMVPGDEGNLPPPYTTDEKRAVKV